jgi:hypothetical protein
MEKINHNIMYYMHHAYISNLFIGEDEGNDWVYVKLVVTNFNKWFLDLSIFNASKLFNPKHDLDHVPQFFYIFLF